MKEHKPPDLEAFGEHLLGKSKYSIFSMQFTNCTLIRVE